MQRSYFSGCGSTGRRSIVDGFRDGTKRDGQRRQSLQTVFSRCSDDFYEKNGPVGSVCGKKSVTYADYFGRAVSGRCDWPSSAM